MLSLINNAEQQLCSDGVRITSLNADKFKRCRVSVNFIWENTREDATAAALLPYLLERGYADYPDMTELSKKLAALYGAELSAGVSSAGSNRVLTLSVSGIKNEFALNNECLTDEYLQLAFGASFRPSFDDNGFFCSDAVDIEREKLREALESEINEKRSYCIRQARRRFFENTPQGVEAAGYLEDVNFVTPQAVTAAYYKMLNTAQIELITFGFDTENTKKSLSDAIKTIVRAPKEKQPISAQKPVKANSFTQEVDAVQGKLCMLFTCGEVFKQEDFARTRVAVALLGTTPTSRLFMNVREKQSLCYYCAASFAYTTGVLCIDCGIEHNNADKAKKAIIKEIDKLLKEPILSTELEDTKKCLINSIKSMGDSLSGLENWFFGEIIRGSLKNPQSFIEEINTVTAEDVKRVLSCFTLSVEYVLTQKGAVNE